MEDQNSPCCEKERVIHKDPNTMTYDNYFDHLVAFNQELHETISCEIERTLGASNQLYCIATTGSDARLEKGPVSLVEIILFGSKPYIDDSATEKLIRHLHKPSQMRFYEDHIEIKEINDDMSTSRIIKQGEQITLVSPNRVLDARLIYGSPLVLKSGKDKLKADLKSDEGKDTLEKLRDKVRQHRKVTLSGVQSYRGQAIRHFSLDEGVANYNPSEYTWSFKQGPLRAVQFAIMRDVAAFIRTGENLSFSQMQPNTVARLNQFAVTGNLNLTQPELSDLCDSYKYFLWQYHRSQDAYQYKGLKQTDFDKVEVRERCKAIERLVQVRIVGKSTETQRTAYT